jgi:hypothetical protein
MYGVVLGAGQWHLPSSPFDTPTMTPAAYPFQLRMPLRLNHGVTIARRMSMSALPKPGETWPLVTDLETKVSHVFPVHDPYPVVELCGFTFTPGQTAHELLMSFSQAGWFFSPPGMVDTPRMPARVQLIQGHGVIKRESDKTIHFFKEHYDLLVSCDHYGSHVEAQGRALIQLARTQLDYSPSTTPMDIMRSLRKHLRKVRQIREALG